MQSEIGRWRISNALQTTDCPHESRAGLTCRVLTIQRQVTYFAKFCTLEDAVRNIFGLLLPRRCHALDYRAKNSAEVCVLAASRQEFWFLLCDRIAAVATEMTMYLCKMRRWCRRSWSERGGTWKEHELMEGRRKRLSRHMGGTERFSAAGPAQ